MLRKTRITLVVPWDDEDNDHPSSWGWDVMINNVLPHEVVVVDFEDQDPPEEVDDS